MKLQYLQENQLFELVGGSRKSKASFFVVFVVVVVAAARLELRSPRFKVISRVYGGIWKDTFNSSKFLQLFIKFKQGTHHYGTAYAGPASARRPGRRRPARTQITGLSYACAWVHIENQFSLSCTQKSNCFQCSPLQLILLASTGHRQQQEDEELDEYQAGPTGRSSNTGSHA